MRTQIQIGSGNRVDPRKRNSNQHCPRLVLFLCMRDSDFCIIPLKKETATKFNKLVFSSKKKKSQGFCWGSFRFFSRSNDEVASEYVLKVSELHTRPHVNIED